MDKHDIAHILEEIGLLLEIKGENVFKIRAYHTAARSLENLDENLETIIREERLQEVEGIGKKIAEKIEILISTGHLPYYEELKKSLPAGLLELMSVSGLGAKKVKHLFENLNIKNLSELENACKKGQLSQLEGFGPKSEENILTSIGKLKVYGKRMLWWEACRFALPIMEELSKLKQVQRVEIAGSFRRRLETVGDLDFLVASSQPGPVMDWFTSYPLVEKVQSKGRTKSSVRLKNGLQADLRVVPDEEYAYALLYFTGSKDFNIHLRGRANHLGYSLNEYSLKGKKGPPCKDEKAIFNALKLDYIPPELREGQLVIEAAEKGKLPKLVEAADIRGVFHCHTTESDGHNTLEEMVAAADENKWEYFGIADHSKSSIQANGMSEERLFNQIEKIRKLNKSKKFSVHIFAGLECDILKDGTLDFPDEVLARVSHQHSSRFGQTVFPDVEESSEGRVKLTLPRMVMKTDGDTDAQSGRMVGEKSGLGELDYVVASVHRAFNQSEKEMTARLIKAIENPYTTMVGHVTGRLLLKREPYAVNLPKVIDACIANETIMELNAHPKRLDMDWRFWHKAAEKGLMCCINPDAHSTTDLDYYLAGLNAARKGWLEKTQILNTFSLAKVKKYIKKTKGE